jgi:transposase
VLKGKVIQVSSSILMTWKKLTDRQWAVVQPHLPPPVPKPQGGRPPLSNRRCFEGILWILWTGAQWKALPKEFGSSSAVQRRLGQWAQAGVLLNLWRAFLSQLNERQQIRWNECFVDGTFVSAKKGALKSAKPSAAREASSWYWPMARVLRSEFSWKRHRLPR